MIKVYRGQTLVKLVALPAAAVVLAALIGLGLTYWLVGLLDERTDNVSADSHLAVLTAESEVYMSSLIEIMTRRAATFLTAPEVLALPPEDQAELRRGLLMPGETVSLPNLTALPIPLSLTEAIEFQRSLGILEGTATLLLAGSSGSTVTDVAETRAVLTAYFVEPTVAHFESFMDRLNALRAETQSAIPRLTAATQSSESSLTSLLSYMRVGLVVLVVFLAGGVLIVLLLTSRSIQRALHNSYEEREQLARASETLRYRNSQLSALYNVYNEITDTLSLRYVVNATVKEALNLVKADFVVLRLIRDDRLVVAGSLDSEGNELPDLPEAELGEGAVGRVAKRGRPILIGSESYDLITEAQRTRGLRSGVIVPLIVGARIRGTLACWSRRDDAFNDEDEHILEMMASQVATAVAAADTNDTHERRAHYDVLTGLPNRRQLNVDMLGDLGRHASTGGTAIFAMVDIDHFKRFNDDFGHRVGDVTLQKVAAVLRTSVREGDRVYRLGGEEFLIIFVNAGRSDADMLTERVRAAVASTPLTGDSLEPVGPVTISMGLSLLPEQSVDFTALMSLADDALYRAKDTGRNRVVLSDGGETPAREAQVA